MWAASRIWDRLGIESSLEIPEGTDSDEPCGYPQKTHFVFLTFRTVREYVCVVLSLQSFGTSLTGYLNKDREGTTMVLGIMW